MVFIKQIIFLLTVFKVSVEDCYNFNDFKKQFYKNNLYFPTV